jgi:hypothetical protein
VLATREPSQHLAGLAFVARLAEDRAVQENERVGGEDPIGGVERGGRGGLLARETRRGVPARLTRRDRFVDAGRDGGERNAERREDLRAAGRAGGEEEGDRCHSEANSPVIPRSEATRNLISEEILRFAQDDGFAIGFLASLGMTTREITGSSP